MNILFKAIYRLNAIPIKLSMVFFHRIKIKIFIIYMKTQKTQVAKAILKKKIRCAGIRLPKFRLYYKATK